MKLTTSPANYVTIVQEGYATEGLNIPKYGKNFGRIISFGDITLTPARRG